MKKVLFICLVVVCIMVVGCGISKKDSTKNKESKKTEDTKKNKEDNEIVLIGKKDGVETLDNSNPTITLLKNEKRFTFVIHPICNNIPMGMYEIKNDELILSVDNDSENSKYVFKIKENEYIFDASKSAEVPKVKLTAKGKEEVIVSNGMVFSELK